MNPDQSQSELIREMAEEAFANEPELLDQKITTQTTSTGLQIFWILDKPDDIEVFNLTNSVKNNFTTMHLEVNITEEDPIMQKIQALQSNKRGILKLLVNLDNGYDFNVQESIKLQPSTNLLKKRNKIFLERFADKYEITENNGINIKLKSEDEGEDAKYARLREYLLDQLSVIDDMIEDYNSRLSIQN